MRSGVRVAIIGPPNVGKSSIMNHLAGRKAAIVSATPGTTRDAIEVSMDISGYKVCKKTTLGSAGGGARGLDRHMHTRGAGGRGRLEIRIC